MKKAFFCFLALCACMGLFAQQRPVVAVAPFDVISGVSATDAAMITRVFFIRLGNTRQVNLVDRTVVERVIREHNFQSGDWSNQQKTAALGSALNADWIVRGEMEKFGSTILLTVSFYNIKTFRFEGGTDARLANADDAYDKMDPLIDKLIQTIGGTGARPPGGGTAPGKTYKIGDTGPGGGIVFFDRGFTGDGWRYLESAPAGAEFTAEWGAYGQDVANTMLAVGFGKQNTKLIVDRLKALGETNKAAQLCAALDVNGYKDWFLPSKDELDLMYKNLKQKGLGGFKTVEDTKNTEIYWSSSQYSNHYSWYQNFRNGFQNYGYTIYIGKFNTFTVRAIRAF
ncbi:MAG: DUF1566 domain-containing protein [Treponema sp.]|jgi:TolB-like protein|nr:DUF1566 domain-containing protein [Treponema sp.]